MAVSVILHIGGDPRELLADYERGSRLTPDATAPGVIYHACLELPHSIKLITHFATEANARAFLSRPEVEAALADVSLVDGAPAVVAIHRHWIAGEPS